MSSHSRSSSEILTLQFSDIMPTFFNAFRDNFDFDDVRDDVRHLFSKEEYLSIINEPDDLRRLVLLFWILCSKEIVLSKFVEIIKQNYEFLTEPIKNQREHPSKQTLAYIEKAHQLRSSNPKHTDFNVLRLDLYIALRNALRKLKRHHSVVLYGDLGMGKKWLTTSVCYDYSVMRAMNFQIYWLDVGDCNSPERDLNRLQSLRLMLGEGNSGTHSPTFSNGGSSSNGFVPAYADNNSTTRSRFDANISNRILEMQQRLRKLLSSPEHDNCLVILQNVNNFKTFQAFNLGCKILVITRNRKVCESLTPTMSKRLNIEHGLTLCEFYTLFEKYLEQPRDEFPKNAIEIYDYSKGHPYLLSIIAQNLRQNKAKWNEWIHSLQNREITDKKLQKVVEISLKVLPDDYLRLYASLGVFPQSVPIPVKLIAALWDKSFQEAEEIIQHFNTYSFISKVPCNPDEDNSSFCCCAVPFIYSSHLQSKSMRASINSDELHGKIIQYYKIEQIFTQRTEIDLCTSQHDQYFFSCIGFHLHKAGRNELFQKIYLDFGFLEQKIRAIGLSNTLSDLRKYENEIINSDYRKDKLLTEVREFLAKIEEKLIESKDTSLLQYALMASDLVYEEATRQIQKFPQRVWFSERGNFHKRRQIVNLMCQAKGVRFLDQDMCLIVLTNGDMLLLDISLDCNNSQILLKNNDHDHKDTPISEARLFRDNKFLITLDSSDTLKVWSIADDHRRSLVYRRSSRHKAHSLNFHNNHKMRCRKFKQCIKTNSKGQHGFISAFFIEQLPPSLNNDTYLHIAFKNGDVCVYKWDSDREEFAAEQIPILQTKACDTRFLIKILGKYYMLISKSGNITFWNLRDSSKSYVPFAWPENDTGPLSYEQFTFKREDTSYTRIIFVFADKVLSLIFKHEKYSKTPNGKVEVVYQKNSITCAKLSQDQHYLVLGTKRGLILYDMLAKSEVLRSNVSDTIACVDIYPLDDRVYKYIIICGAEHRKALHLFAVRTNDENGITWAHNVTSLSNEVSSDPQLEADVWLLGQKLYDIDYKEDDSTLVVAVDSKFRVHQVNTTKTKSWNIITPSETIEPITSITTGREQAFVGYKNGYIFNINKDVFEENSMENSINYLQIIDDCHLVASSDFQTIITNVGDTAKITKTFPFSTRLCYKIKSKYILLLNATGIFTLIEIEADDYVHKLEVNGLRENEWDIYTLSGSDFQNNHLCLASETFVKIFVFYCNENNTRFFPIINQYITNAAQSHKNCISCISLTKDASLVAIGYTNGEIELHKLLENRIEFVYRLQSHHTRINDMIFSPGNEILVSCAEQLCFWSILYVQNNQLIKGSPKRRSSRFSSQHSYETEVDAKVVMPHENYLSIHSSEQKNGHGHGHKIDIIDDFHSLKLTNGSNSNNKLLSSPWRDKHGPADKPELLSCIKFDGKKAEKLFASPNFTQFNTIDDEGVYYHLVMFDNIINEKSSSVMYVPQLDLLDVMPTHFSAINDENSSSMGEDEVYV